VIDEIVTQANNPQKLNPPFYLSPEIVQIGRKKVVYVFVPESSQVHQTVGKIFDRNEDGDFDITSQNEQVTQLYLRKQSTYTENKIYPHVKLSDFKQELFQKVRNLARSERPDHPWLSLEDEALLRSAGLYKKDYLTGDEGYTLAAVLLFGKDEVIHNILPAYKTDAIKRVENPDKYDDRDVITTNLIDSFDRMMIFVQKHLPDKFYMEKDQRISLRSRIFYEVVANLLIHREFTNSYPAKFIIEKDQVITENWNRPHGNGKINPDNFSPFPKNPVIAKFFHQIGRAEELGSGIRNTYKYVSQYAAGTQQPEFIEEDVFKTMIPIPILDESGPGKSSPSPIMAKRLEGMKGEIIDEVRKKFGEEFGESSEKILVMIQNKPTISAKEMAEQINLSPRAVEKNLATLKEKGVIDRIGPPRGGKWKVNV
jgi:ATP-dependent DNA helicase RecG